MSEFQQNIKRAAKRQKSQSQETKQTYESDLDITQI